MSWYDVGRDEPDDFFPLDPYGGDDTRPTEFRIPDRWPSAWPHLWRPARDRMVFVLAVMALTTAGIIALGEPAGEWWVPLVPAVLLIGPVTRPGRARRELRRACRRGRVATAVGRLEAGPPTRTDSTTRLLTTYGTLVRLPATGELGRALAAHVGEVALLVWAPRWWRRRKPAALVLTDLSVCYQSGVPKGMRRVSVAMRVTSAGRLL